MDDGRRADHPPRRRVLRLNRTIIRISCATPTLGLTLCRSRSSVNAVRFLVAPNSKRKMTIPPLTRTLLAQFLQGGMNMHSSFLKTLVLAAALLATAVGSLPAHAQADAKDKSPIYTYVAQWDVARPNWPAIEKYNASQKPVFDKLIADGTIIGYGYYKLAAHSEGSPNHGTWWTATSMANLLKVLSLVATQPAGPDVDRIEAASKHWDLVLVSRQYGVHSGSFDNGYLRVSTYKVKPDKAKRWTKRLTPTFSQSWTSCLPTARSTAIRLTVKSFTPTIQGMSISRSSRTTPMASTSSRRRSTRLVKQIRSAARPSEARRSHRPIAIFSRSRPEPRSKHS